MENNVYEDLDFGHPDNSSPCYEQALPEMDTTQPTSYPSPKDYGEALSEVQPARVAVPPPYDNNTSKGFFPKPAGNPFPGPTHPNEVRVSLPHPTNNLEMIQNANPNPQFLRPQTLEPTAPKMASHQPMLFSSPQSVMIDGVMPPPPQHTKNYPVQGPVFFAPQPMVVTNQTTVMSTETPYYRDYLPWSIFNLLCCCCCFGIVATIFSVQTRSAKRYQDWESAKRKSCTALGFNLAATLLGIAIIIIVPSVYYTLYYTKYYSYYNDYYNNYYNNYPYYG